MDAKLGSAMAAMSATGSGKRLRLGSKGILGASAREVEVFEGWALEAVSWSSVLG